MDQHYLARALVLASNYRGQCAPNPAVGAVIVVGRHIIAEGSHEGPGQPHAEVVALQSLASLPAEATLYVTLEPCCHQGRTPPCTQVIIKAGIKRVVYAYEDPNPLVRGKGAAMLRAADIEVAHVPLETINAFYQSYHYWHQTKRPWLTAKIAQSLNGVIAGPKGERLSLTGASLEKMTHQLRWQSDALLTTAKTIIADDPQMNVRDEQGVRAKPVYIIDRYLQTPLHAKIFKTAAPLSFFYDAQYSAECLSLFQAQGATCIPLDCHDDGFDLAQIIAYLGKQGHHDIWMESGGRLMTAMWQKNLINQLYIYIAPKWIDKGMLAFYADISFADKDLSFKQCGNECYLQILSKYNNLQNSL